VLIIYDRLVGVKFRLVWMCGSAMFMIVLLSIIMSWVVLIRVRVMLRWWWLWLCSVARFGGIMVFVVVVLDMRGFLGCCWLGVW